MTSTKSEAAAAVRIGAGLALRRRHELLAPLRPCFARTEPWLRAGKYTGAVMSELPERNGRSVARSAGDRTPDKTQRLLNYASWNTFAAMGVVRRFAVAWLEEAARRGGRRRGLVIGAIDESGQARLYAAIACHAVLVNARLRHLRRHHRAPATVPTPTQPPRKPGPATSQSAT